MKTSLKIAALLSPAALTLASCSTAKDVDTQESAAKAADAIAFTTEEHGTFDKGWAAAFVPGTASMVVTEKGGGLFLYDTNSRAKTAISGAPTVAYGGQGGLGDVAFLNS
ncbi:MAG: PQQ-dependent sugar dehydrogenase, partial [Marinomonas sp.]